MAKIIGNPGRFADLNDPRFSSERPVFSLIDRPWSPSTDIYEHENLVIIKMEVPGIPTADIELTVHGRQMVVRGRRREPQSKSVRCYHLMEVQYGEFRRIFDFPFNLRMKDIKASTEDGFLVIELPKKAGSTGSVTIEIYAEEHQVL